MRETSVAHRVTAVTEVTCARLNASSIASFLYGKCGPRIVRERGEMRRTRIRYQTLTQRNLIFSRLSEQTVSAALILRSLQATPGLVHPSLSLITTVLHPGFNPSPVLVHTDGIASWPNRPYPHSLRMG